MDAVVARARWRHRTPHRALARLLAAVLPIVSMAACRPAPAQSPATAPAPTVTPAIGQAVLDSMRRVLTRAIDDSAFPGAFAIVGTSTGVIAELGVGRIDWAAEAPAPTSHTLWDLASLTKVVGMTSAVMQLVDQGRLALDAPVQRYLPDWTGPGKDGVTIRHLLTHTSGLPAFRLYYREATSPADARRLFFATPLDTVPGSRMVYSDIGAWLLGQVVERVSGESLDRFLEARLFTPLGMRETRYRPPAALLPRIAPTEIDPWRGRKVHGEVHDENAHALGGVSAHAGIFSSAHDLARFARAYLNEGTLDGVRVFTPATVRLFTTRADSGSSRALGWDTATGRNSAGRRMSGRTFGHTGFTGTSLWIDPERDLFVILLSNRVNPTRENTKIGGVRIALADAVVGAVAGRAPVGGASSPSSPRP